MRILYINVICKHGSTGKITYDLYTQCKDDGHEAVVCYGRGPKLKEPDVYKFGLDWETNVHALLTRLTGVNGCWSFFSTRRLLKFMDAFKPDVVHLHEPLQMRLVRRSFRKMQMFPKRCGSLPRPDFRPHAGPH